MINIESKLSCKNRKNSLKKITQGSYSKFRNLTISWSKERKNQRVNNKNFKIFSKQRQILKDNMSQQKLLEIKSLQKTNNSPKLKINLFKLRLSNKNNYKN